LADATLVCRAHRAAFAAPATAADDGEPALLGRAILPPDASQPVPLQSVESPEVLGGERLLIANDNNHPFSDGRWIARDRPDHTELTVIRAPRCTSNHATPTEEYPCSNPAAKPAAY
jgi:hypothetical protein